MRKIIISFVISALVLISLVIWAFRSGFSGNPREILMMAGALLVVGFALFLGFRRVRSHLRREPAEDELSKQVMTRTAALSYHLSLFWWLVVMYFSDQISLPVHSLIGVGIMGMAVIFLLSWLWTRVRGMGHD